MLKFNVKGYKFEYSNKKFQYIICWSLTSLKEMDSMRIYEFQYILCCCLMPLHCILLSLRNYVSIHPMLLFNSYPLSINFNVLAVSIHPMLLFNFRVVICSNPRTTVSIHPMLLFNCKFSQFPGSPSPVSIHPMLLFNVCSTNCYTC